MFDKIKQWKQRMHEEQLLMKVEAVTDNAMSTRLMKMMVCLVELCDDMENTSLVFSALRARISGE